MRGRCDDATLCAIGGVWCVVKKQPNSSSTQPSGIDRTTSPAHRRPAAPPLRRPGWLVAIDFNDRTHPPHSPPSTSARAERSFVPTRPLTRRPCKVHALKRYGRGRASGCDLLAAGGRLTFVHVLEARPALGALRRVVHTHGGDSGRAEGSSCVDAATWPGGLLLQLLRSPSTPRRPRSRSGRAEGVPSFGELSSSGRPTRRSRPQN